MCEYDPALALHCLAGVGNRVCPIISQRTTAMKTIDDPECQGQTPLEILFGFLVEAMREMMANDGIEKKKKIRAYEYARGQVESLAYSIALIRNPYHPDAAAVKLEAETLLDL